jgi:hypothetical protein
LFLSQSQTSPQATEPIRLLGIPYGLDEAAVPSGVMQVSRGELPDVIVLTEWNSAQLIVSRLPAGMAAILPVVDASRGQGAGGGVNGLRADLRITTPSRGGISDALAMLGPVIESVRSLPPAVLCSVDPRLMLLARLMVRDRGVEPRRDPNARETIVYADESSVPGVVRHAEDLVALGLLHREFFDSLITCPRCQSGRLCAHERCAVPQHQSDRRVGPPSSALRLRGARARVPQWADFHLSEVPGASRAFQRRLRSARLTVGMSSLRARVRRDLGGIPLPGLRG